MIEYIVLPRRAKDITGERFGRLVALGPVKHEPGSSVFWLCQCDCGNTTTVPTRNLNYGTSKSCGCLFKDSAKTRAATHGKCYTHVYRVWQNMNRRCHTRTNDAYALYGGRGITVYPEWRTSFEDFEFYVAQLPHFEEEGYTLDRVDNDGNYEPGNVKWSTQAEQLRNTRRTRFFTLNGKTQCLKDWCKEFSIAYSTFYQRLEYGWDIQRALSEPVRASLRRRLSDAECLRLVSGLLERKVERIVELNSLLRYRDGAPASKSDTKEEPLYPGSKYEVTS